MIKEVKHGCQFSRAFHNFFTNTPNCTVHNYTSQTNISCYFLSIAAIGDDTTKGIEELVSKQRDHKPKASNRKGKPGNFHISYPRFQPVILPRRGQAKPALPAHLRSQLKQLLSYGPVRLSELESRYVAQFGKPLKVTQYGFFSISEMLSAAMDFIIMQQSRTGSQLFLKSAVTPQNETENLMRSFSKQRMYMNLFIYF